MTSPIAKDGLDQFRVLFATLAKTRRGEPTQIDPFLIAQAIGLVMRECTVRGATGAALVWNDYRMIMARADYERIRPLQSVLERDLKVVLADTARQRAAELVGELRVTVIPDDADELPHAEAVVRVAFVPTDKLSSPRTGEMTMRLDAWTAAGEIVATPSNPGSDTVFVADAGAACTLAWTGGSAPIPPNTTVVIGRPHPDAPPHFIALTGAGATVNKQHFFVLATERGVKIGRFPKANPVHVNGALLEAGAETEVALPVELSLARGDFTVSVRR
jgi:hypothetical protein